MVGGAGVRAFRLHLGTRSSLPGATGSPCGQLRRPRDVGRRSRAGLHLATRSSLPGAAGGTIRSLRSQVPPPAAPSARRWLGSPRARPAPHIARPDGVRFAHRPRLPRSAPLVAGSGRLKARTPAPPTIQPDGNASPAGPTIPSPIAGSGRPVRSRPPRGPATPGPDGHLQQAQVAWLLGEISVCASRTRL